MRRTSQYRGKPTVFWLLSIVIVMVAETRGTTACTVHARCLTPERLPRRGTRQPGWWIDEGDVRLRVPTFPSRKSRHRARTSRLEDPARCLLESPSAASGDENTGPSLSLTSTSCEREPLRAGNGTEGGASVRAIAASVTSGASGETPERPAHPPPGTVAVVLSTAEK